MGAVAALAQEVSTTSGTLPLRTGTGLVVGRLACEGSRQEDRGQVAAGSERSSGSVSE